MPFSKGGKTGKFARFYFCCFSVESTPQAFKADLCCLHLGSGHIGADDVGSMIIGRSIAECNLCCVGCKVNEARDAGHQPGTQMAASGATTLPGGGAPPSYNHPPPAGYGTNQPQVSAPGPQQMGPMGGAYSQDPAGKSGGDAPVMGIPVQKTV